MNYVEMIFHGDIHNLQVIPVILIYVWAIFIFSASGAPERGQNENFVPDRHLGQMTHRSIAFFA